MSKKTKNLKRLNGFAIWLDSKGASPHKVHIDVNIWFNKREENQYIEFGIKIDRPQELSSVYMCIPYVVRKDEVEDKVDQLSDASLTSAIFNRHMRVSDVQGVIEVSYIDNIDNKSLIDEDFICGKLPSDYTCEEQYEGMILCIPSDKSVKKEEHIYYRFRIKKVDKNILSDIDDTYFLVDGIFKKTNFLEFSINDVRKINHEIIGKMSKISIESVNVFLMTNQYINLVFKSKDIYKARILEGNVWDEYVGNDEDKSKIIAYHWKEGSKTSGGYDLFVKTSYISRQTTLMIIVVLLPIVYGIVSNILYNNFKCMALPVISLYNILKDHL